MKAKPGPVDLLIFYLCIFIMNKSFKLLITLEGVYAMLYIAN